MDNKSPDAFRTISEVADWLGVPTHVLRFWESRFTQVKPVKRAGGRRYYRPADMALLGGIRKLLHDDGMTIRGVQKILREQGVAHVAALADPALDSEGDVIEAEAVEVTSNVVEFDGRAEEEVEEPAEEVVEIEVAPEPEPESAPEPEAAPEPAPKPELTTPNEVPLPDPVQMDFLSHEAQPNSYAGKAGFDLAPETAPEPPTEAEAAPEPEIDLSGLDFSDPVASEEPEAQEPTPPAAPAEPEAEPEAEVVAEAAAPAETAAEPQTPPPPEPEASAPADDAPASTPETESTPAQAKAESAPSSAPEPAAPALTLPDIGPDPADDADLTTAHAALGAHLRARPPIAAAEARALAERLSDLAARMSRN
ncbi:MAG: MerR family transcriptional regulator [Rhodobacterales bacterium]|nr:MAG: MerR family transcriptional regulator [Rhodobacterales bacterium]